MSRNQVVTLVYGGIGYTGGVERVHAEFAKYLAARGYTLRAICSTIDPEIRDLCQEVIHIEPPHSRLKGPFGAFSRRWQWMAAATKIIHARRAELGVVLTSPGATWCSDVVMAGSNHLAACLSRRKSEFSLWPLNPLNLFSCVAEFWPYHHGVKQIIVPSRRTKREIQNLYHVNPDKIDVLPHGVDLKHFRPAGEERTAVRERLGIEKNAIVFLSVTNELHRKGCFLVLEALQRLQGKADGPIHYYTAGRDDSRAFLQRAEALGLGGQVHALGSQSPDGLLALYQAADAFVMPTYYESFCLVCMEAMACGVPVIGTKVGGMEDYMSDGENSIVIARTVPDITRALELVIRDPALRQRLSDGALRTSGEYNWPSVLEGFEKVVDVEPGK